MFTFDTIVTETRNLLNELNLIESIQTILVVTTSEVYKLDGQKISRRDDDELGGKDPYAASKAAVALLVACRPIREDITMATAQSGNVVGNGDWSENRLVPDIVRSGLTKAKLEARNPSAIHPWLHVTKPIHGYFLMGEAMQSKSCRAKAINFGSLVEIQITSNHIISYRLEILPKELRSDKVCTPQKYIKSKLLLLDSEFAKRELGWRPLLDWKETIQISSTWYVDFENGASARDLIEQNIDFYLNWLS